MSVGTEKKVISWELRSLKERIIKKIESVETQIKHPNLSSDLKERLLERAGELRERLLEVEYLMKKLGDGDKE